MANRLLIADNSGDELFEIDPDGADSQGTRLRALPAGLTSPFAMTVFIGSPGAPGTPIGMADGTTVIDWSWTAPPGT